MQNDAGAQEPGQTDTGNTLAPTAALTSPENPWPLALLSKNLKAYIDRAPAAWVEGQVIELNRRSNASFITLRDVDAEVSLSLTVWSTVMNRLELPLERGARVVALIKPDFWVKTGRLSMQTRDIRPVGLGDLLARIERLRQALAAEGLFAASRKQRLPLLPGRIGLITGRNSDAMKDVMRNAALRWPAVRVRGPRGGRAGRERRRRSDPGAGCPGCHAGSGRDCHCPRRRLAGGPAAVQP